MAGKSFTHSELKDYVAENFVLGEDKGTDGQVVQVKLTKKQSDELLKVIFSKVAEEVTSGNDVKMLGIGTAKRIARKARTGRNPRDPEQIIEIPAHYSMRVDAERALKETLKALEVNAEELK